MGINPFWRRQSGSHQEGRPIDRVKAHDIFAHHVQIGGPIFSVIAGFIRISQRGDVIGQRIHPDIHDVFGLIGHRYPPIETGTRDRKIVETTFDKTDDLVAPRHGSDEIRVFIIKLQQRFLPSRQPEEITRFLEPLDLGPRRRNFLAIRSFGEFTLTIECFVTHRIPAGIGT